MNLPLESQLECLSPTPAPWASGAETSPRMIETNRALAELLAALFGVPANSTDEVFHKAGLRLIEEINSDTNYRRSLLDRDAIEALSARVDQLEIDALSSSDLAVCKQLGLTAKQFLGI